MRKLLSTEDVAEKLGFSKTWMYRNKVKLLRNGFPPPVIGANRGSHPKWDERSIDAWLDNQMPRNLREKRVQVSEMTRNYDALLEERFNQITI